MSVYLDVNCHLLILQEFFMIHLWLFTLFDLDCLGIALTLVRHYSMSFHPSRAAASTSENDDLTEISIIPLHLSL